MVKKVVTWVLVADGAHAKLYQNDGPGHGLAPVEGDSEFSIPHPKISEMVSDRQPRTHDSMGQHRHAVEPEVDPRRHEEIKFVKSLADMLSRKAQAGAYDRVVLIAAPRALGELRAELDKHVQEKLHGTVPKDLVQHSAQDVADHLKDLMAV